MDLGGVLEAQVEGPERPPQQPLAPGPPGRPPLISLRNREQKRGRHLLPINASRAQGAAHKRGVAAQASGGLLAAALLTATTALTAALDPDPLNIGGPARVLLEVRAVVGPLLICGDGGWLGHVGVAFLCVVQAGTTWAASTPVPPSSSPQQSPCLGVPQPPRKRHAGPRQDECEAPADSTPSAVSAAPSTPHMWLPTLRAATDTLFRTGGPAPGTPEFQLLVSRLGKEKRIRSALVRILGCFHSFCGRVFMNPGHPPSATLVRPIVVSSPALVSDGFGGTIAGQCSLSLSLPARPVRLGLIVCECDHHSQIVRFNPLPTQQLLSRRKL